MVTYSGPLRLFIDSFILGLGISAHPACTFSLISSKLDMATAATLI